jgi:hypothetical protein
MLKTKFCNVAHTQGVTGRSPVEGGGGRLAPRKLHNVFCNPKDYVVLLRKTTGNLEQGWSQGEGFPPFYFFYKYFL